MTFLCSKTRSAAPHTPRVVLLGATGSGKGVQAALLANKYNIINGENCNSVVMYLFQLSIPKPGSTCNSVFP